MSAASSASVAAQPRHAPLLDHISYADLQAVQAVHPRHYNVLGLDEYGIARIPIVHALEMAISEYEDAFETRIAIAVHIVKAYGANRPIVVAATTTTTSASSSVVVNNTNNSVFDHAHHAQYETHGPNALHIALAQVTLYPEHLQPPHFPPSAASWGEEEQEQESTTTTTTSPLPLLPLSLSLKFSPPPEAAMAAVVAVVTVEETKEEEEEDEEEEVCLMMSLSDIDLVKRLVSALIRDAGASAGMDGVLETAVRHGLFELLPMLFKASSSTTPTPPTTTTHHNNHYHPKKPKVMPCLHRLISNHHMRAQRVLATLGRLERSMLVVVAVGSMKKSGGGGGGGEGAQSARLQAMLDAIDSDFTGATPLHLTATLCRPSGAAIAMQLLRLGANPFATNTFGDTPIDVARAQVLKHSPLLQSPTATTTTTVMHTRQRQQAKMQRAQHALAVQKVLETAERKRACELAVMMATHPRLGGGGGNYCYLHHCLEPSLLRLIAREACALD